MRRRTFITLISSAERLIGGTTMRGILQRSVIAATTVLAIAAFPDPAKAGGVVTAPFYWRLRLLRLPVHLRLRALGLR